MTCRTSSRATSRRTGTDRKETERFQRVHLRRPGSSGTRPASTSSGSRTRAWRTTDNLPDPDVLATEIAENLEAALEQFRGIAKDLGE